jgi:hypothetical protein
MGQTPLISRPMTDTVRDLAFHPAGDGWRRATKADI